MSLKGFDWVPDPDAPQVTCPKCGGSTESLRVEPPRGAVYLNWIWLCETPGCRTVWPSNGARRMEAA